MTDTNIGGHDRAKIIAGVYVTGLRGKRFIPATTGAAGADIVVVTERWYSPELKIQLLPGLLIQEQETHPKSSQTWTVVNQIYPNFKFPPTIKLKP